MLLEFQHFALAPLEPILLLGHQAFLLHGVVQKMQFAPHLVMLVDVGLLAWICLGVLIGSDSSQHIHC
jgi:hypothetical protein